MDGTSLAPVSAMPCVGVCLIGFAGLLLLERAANAQSVAGWRAAADERGATGAEDGDQTDDRRSDPPPAPQDSHAWMALGVARGKSAGGVGLEGLFTHRVGMLTLGGELGATAPIAVTLAAGVLGGLSVGNRLGIGVYGALGVHHYDGVGRRLFSDDPGTSGTLPYAGARLVLWARLGDGSWYLGVLATADEDLVRDTHRYAYTDDDCDLFGGCSPPTVETAAPEWMDSALAGAALVGGRPPRA